jgi:site-specific recombinase XerD
MAPATQEAYLWAVYGLAKYYHRSPDLISDEELKNYMFYLVKEREFSASSLNQVVSGLRFFYSLVLQRSIEHLRASLPRVRRDTRRPQVYSRAELERLFTEGCSHPKQRAFLVTVYGAGLRLNEACHLKLSHINRARMQIRVEQGKGRKDRYTLLAPSLLEELESYWQCFRPQNWLFPSSSDPQLPLGDGNGQKYFYSALQRAQLPNRGGIHSLRHSFATHLVEAGVEITIVQMLLGHSQLSTTSTYLHVQAERIAQIQSPLQLLNYRCLPFHRAKT